MIAAAVLPATSAQAPELTVTAAPSVDATTALGKCRVAGGAEPGERVRGVEGVGDVRGVPAVLAVRRGWCHDVADRGVGLVDPDTCGCNRRAASCRPGPRMLPVPTTVTGLGLLPRRSVTVPPASVLFATPGAGRCVAGIRDGHVGVVPSVGVAGVRGRTLADSRPDLSMSIRVTAGQAGLELPALSTHDPVPVNDWLAPRSSAFRLPGCWFRHPRSQRRRHTRRSRWRRSNRRHSPECGPPSPGARTCRCRCRRRQHA